MFQLSAYLIYVFVCAYTPGPNNIMSMSNAIQVGFKRGVTFNLGILTGFVILMPICAVFSGAIFQFIPQYEIYMFIAGAAYMLWLAWKTWTSKVDVEAHERKNMGFVTGIVVQFINPKLYISTITAMSVYVLPYYKEPFTLIGYALIQAFVGFTGTIIWALFGSALCGVLEKHSKLLNGILALLLVYCAVSLFMH